jgi:hypothetical protein
MKRLIMLPQKPLMMTVSYLQHLVDLRTPMSLANSRRRSTQTAVPLGQRHQVKRRIPYTETQLHRSQVVKLQRKKALLHSETTR